MKLRQHGFYKGPKASKEEKALSDAFVAYGRRLFHAMSEEEQQQLMEEIVSSIRQALRNHRRQP